MPPKQPLTAKQARAADVGTSVRSRSKPAPTNDQPRKQVYRQVLDNPINLTWPPLPASTRNAILDELLNLITTSTTNDGKSVADWRLDEHAKRRGNVRGQGKGKGKANEEDIPKEEKQPLVPAACTSSSSPNSPPESYALSTRTASYTIPNGSDSSASTSSAPPSTKPSLPPSPPPELLSHLVVGINEVTRALESRVRWGRWELGDRAAAPQASPPSVEPVKTPGRHRTRKSASGKESAPVALRPHSAKLERKLDLSSLPEYAFARKKAAGLSREERPLYLVEGADGSLRMLVNSDARRLKAAPKGATEGAKGPAGGKEKTVEAEGSSAAEAVSSGDVDDTAKLLLPTATNQPSAPFPTPTPTASASTSTSSSAPTVPLIDLIFVCKPDINPPSLVAHLPGMCAAVNGVHEALKSVLSTSEEATNGEAMEVEGEEGSSGVEAKGKRPEMRKVLLIPLDLGAESRLADALALRRVAAIGFSSSTPGIAPLLALLARHSSSISPITAPWLVPHVLHPPSHPAPHPSTSTSASTSTTAAAIPSALASAYQSTTIKHLLTTAPLNPKAANAEKKKRRREGKEREKEEERKKRKGVEGGGVGEGQEGGGEVYVAED